MNANQYIKECLVTESRDMNPIKERLNNEETIRLLHGCIGLSTEIGEMIDVLKKHIFYGKPIDFVNLKEECGDLAWYLAIILDSLNSDFETIMDANIKKLRARYPLKFTEFDAQKRNLQNERKILEENL